MVVIMFRDEPAPAQQQPKIKRHPQRKKRTRAEIRARRQIWARRQAEAQQQIPALRRMLRAPAAADYVGLSISTLNKRRLTGDGPVYTKQGSVVTYDIADLDSYIDARKRVSTSDTEPARRPSVTPPGTPLKNQTPRERGA
jgi:hypothetical protein